MTTIEKAVRTNYNPTGAAIIEKLYGAPGYLSPGGPEATATLAERIQLTAQDHVLDAGCGVGGPALRLAQHYRCRVTGLELVESSDDSARFAGIYHNAMQRIAQQKDSICEQFSERVYDIVMEKNQCLADGFTSGLVGGGSILARCA